MKIKTVSPSRTYVAICVGHGYTSHFFRVFTLPDTETQNDSEYASWYYVNRLDFESCVSDVVTVEDYLKVEVRTEAFGRDTIREPEFQADADANYDVSWDLHCLANDHGNPHVDIRVGRHIVRHLARWNRRNDAEYATRYEAKYRERYGFWLALYEANKLK